LLRARVLTPEELRRRCGPQAANERAEARRLGEEARYLRQLLRTLRDGRASELRGAEAELGQMKHALLDFRMSAAAQARPGVVNE
jgi:hypothetical protein